MLPELQIPDAATMGDIVVPNAYTAQYNSLLTLLLNRDKKTIVCGPTGTGKSTYVFRTITQALPQDKFKPLTLGFSAKTSANMTQDIIDGKLDKRRKGGFFSGKGVGVGRWRRRGRFQGVRERRDELRRRAVSFSNGTLRCG